MLIWTLTSLLTISERPFVTVFDNSDKIMNKRWLISFPSFFFIFFYFLFLWVDNGNINLSIITPLWPAFWHQSVLKSTKMIRKRKLLDHQRSSKLFLNSMTIFQNCIINLLDGCCVRVEPKSVSFSTAVQALINAVHHDEGVIFPWHVTWCNLISVIVGQRSSLHHQHCKQQ